ncbi:MAG: helix-turn-helix transcriptional regulator [Bdellovibrionales bacterium]|nr:helix-turn-helix transcriptional regulator [Bdellovibrionales bacterium]
MRKVRETKDWTLESMEERGFKYWQHYRQLEAGEKSMTLITFLKACRALNSDPSDLLKGVKI